MSFITTFLVIFIIVLAFSRTPSAGRTAARIVVWGCLILVLLFCLLICSAV